jgi:hypothetical protein
MANKPRKGPVPLVAASPKKEVRTETQTAPKQTPVWVFSRVDLNGQWCWSKLEPGELLQIIQRLKNLENVPWSEIERTTGSHPVSKTKFIKAAKERLIEIEQDDVDELFSLRITNVIRIWGIRVNEEFHFLWCDPKHEVCPSTKKHT